MNKSSKYILFALYFPLSLMSEQAIPNTPQSTAHIVPPLQNEQLQPAYYPPQQYYQQPYYPPPYYPPAIPTQTEPQRLDIHLHTNQTQQTQVDQKTTTAVESSALANSRTTNLIPSYEQISPHLQSFKTNIFDYCIDNKLSVAAYGFGSLYLYFLIKLMLLGNEITKDGTWASWKTYTSARLAEKTLAEKLLYAIQQKYQKRESLTDFFTPMTTFLNDLEKERRAITKYIAIHRWAQRLYFSFLLPHQRITYEQAHEKLEHIDFLKDLFLRWITEYKLVQNKSHAVTFNDEPQTQMTEGT